MLPDERTYGYHKAELTFSLAKHRGMQRAVYVPSDAEHTVLPQAKSAQL